MYEPMDGPRGDEAKARETLSRKDPEYYSKMGKRGGGSRKASGVDYSALAAKSHPRAVYRGGRPKGSKNRGSTNQVKHGLVSGPKESKNDE